MTPEFDVIIVGSGPAGTSAAYPLVQAGLRVLMVDAASTAAPRLAPTTLRWASAERYRVGLVHVYEP